MKRRQSFPEEGRLAHGFGPIRTKRLRFGLKLLVQRAFQCRQ